MRSKWTKLISVVCLVAMLVGMLPVVASAAEPIVWTVASKNSFFTVLGGSEKSPKTGWPTEYNGVTYSKVLSMGGDGQGFSFVATTDGTLTAYLSSTSSDTKNSGFQLDGV